MKILAYVFLILIIILLLYARVKDGFILSFNSQIYTNLVWDNLEINDVPSVRNTTIMRKRKGTNELFEVKINSQGFRDYEYNVNKPKDTIRIIAVGDSTTFGEGLNLEDTYVKQLETLLNNCCHRKVEVLNFGANGASTINELELIQKKSILYNPDILLLQMDPNDSDVIKQIKKVDSSLNKLILRLKNRESGLAQWLKCKLEFYKYYRYRKQLTLEDEYNNVTIPLKIIIDICKDRRINLVILSHDPIYRPTYYEKVVKYIKDQNLPFLDLKYSQFENLSYQERYVNGCVDSHGYAIDSHPSKHGGRIIAEELKDIFLTLPEFKDVCF
jgi:hypothetical protein